MIVTVTSNNAQRACYGAFDSDIYGFNDAISCHYWMFLKGRNSNSRSYPFNFTSFFLTVCSRRDGI